MPRIIRTNEETEQSFIRPMTLDVVRRVFEETGIKDIDYRLFFPGGEEVAQQQGSALDPNENEIRFKADGQIQISVTENYIENRLLSTAIHRTENRPIFQDPNLQILIKPIYSPTEYTINIAFRGKDKQSVVRWRDDIRNRVSLSRLERFYEVRYHYLIPVEVEVILKHLHELREKIAGYGEDYSTYLKKYGTKRFTTLSDQAGRNTRLAIAESQRQVQGWFDFNGVPEHESKEGDGDVWTINFSYHVEIDKPLGVNFDYPVSVHQQVIDQRYRPLPEERQYDPRNFEEQRTLSGSFMRHFEEGRLPSRLDCTPGITVPFYDEFVPEVVPQYTKRLWTALTTINAQDPRSLLNLLEFKDLRYDPDLLCLLKREAPYMNKPYQSIFVLTLFRDFAPLDPWLFSVDKDLNVKAEVDLDLRSVYHLRLAFVTDLKKLSKETIDRIRECGDGLIKIISCIDPTLKDSGLLPGIIGENTVPRKDIEDAIKEIDRNHLSWGDMYQFFTVETLFIRTLKGDQNGIS